MRTAGLASLFIAVLVIAAVVSLTMFTMLAWFVTGQGSANAWRSLVAALAAAGVALCATALIHLALVATRHEVTRVRERRLANWMLSWSELAAGGEVPVVPAKAVVAASEAAARVLQQLTGEGAERIRAGLIATGVLAADLEAASRGIGSPRSRATAALERLAWMGLPETLNVFALAARGKDPRAARAALLGAARLLSDQARPEPIGTELVSTIEDHVNAARDPGGTRSFLATVLVASGEHLPWLCSRLLHRNEPEVVHIAALEAIGLSRRPEAIEVATDALLSAVEEETEAAALRTLARIGHVPENAVPAVLEATKEAHVGTRVQAAHALVWVAPTAGLPALWDLLGDTSWEVRRAAAMAMSRCGQPGRQALQRAASTHPDRYGRDIAMVLAGTGGIPAKTADRPVSGQQVARPTSLATEPAT